MRPLSDISLLPDKCDAGSLLAAWSWRVPENYRPILLSLFGDWFLLDREGRVQMFDPISCELRQIAASETEFLAKLETEEQHGYLAIETKAIASRSANEGHGHPYAVRGLVLAGAFTVIQNQKPTTYRPGEIFAVPAGCVHSEEVGAEGAQILVGRKY